MGDSLIEEALREAGRTFERKCRDVDMVTSRPDAQVRVYKMHGELFAPQDIVITRSDHGRYGQIHRLMSAHVCAVRRAARFLIDEDLPRSLARELRGMGVDTVDARDAGLRGRRGLREQTVDRAVPAPFRYSTLLALFRVSVTSPVTLPFSS